MSILLNRMLYMLTPQFDIYEQVAAIVHGAVADVGCGLGFGTQLYMENADSVVGYDIDGDFLSFASRSFTHPHLTFRKGDILGRQPYIIEGRFDVVTMIDVIEHIEFDHDAIGQASSLVAADGMFICSTPNRLSRYRKSDNHVREYDPDQLEALLRLHFPEVKICTYGLERLNLKTQNPLIAICKHSEGIQ